MRLEASKNALAQYGCVRTMNFIQSRAGSPAEDPVRAAADLDAVIRDSRILVVDDQKMVRGPLKIYLTNGGYENLLFAGDGDEALDMIAAEDSDLVVLDLQMPRMNGLDVCKALRADPKYELLPVLVQTAADSAKDWAEIFQSGATDMVGKPINDAELLARVGIHLQNRHMLNQLSLYHEKMERDLQQARDMQHQIMPGARALSSFQEQYDIEIKSHFQTCDELGGDMWNVWPIDEARMGFSIIDFTGHGVVASLKRSASNPWLRRVLSTPIPTATAIIAAAFRPMVQIVPVFFPFSAAPCAGGAFKSLAVSLVIEMYSV